MSFGKKPNRFFEGAKERREGAREEPGRGGLTRIDVDGAVRREDGRAVAVEVFGEVLAVGEDGLVRTKNGTFQLVTLEGHDVLIPTIG